MKFKFKSQDEYEKMQKALSRVSIVFLILSVVGIIILCNWKDFCSLIN